MKRLCSTALCAAALFLATPLGASAGAASIGDKIQSKQAEVEATHKRLEQKREQLRFQEVRAQDMQRQLSETNRGITDVTASLQTLSDQVRSNQRRLAWNKRQLDAAQETLERHNDALRRRLVDAYERGDLSYVNVLLSATSFSDFVERWDDIRYLIATNEKTVRERKETAPALNAHNTFDQPDTLRPAEFSAFKASDTGFSATLPPKSVVVIEAE